MQGTQVKKGIPSAERSHTRWGMGKGILDSLSVKVLTASPRRPGDFPIEVSGSPWLTCIWRRLAHQGVGWTPHARKGDARGRKKMRCRLACAGEKALAARAGNRAPILPRGLLHRCSAGREREEEREKRGEGGENRAATWNPAARRWHPSAPASSNVRPSADSALPPIDSWQLPLLHLAPTPPCLLPNPVGLQPLLQSICIFFLFPNQSGRTPSTPLPTSSWFFFRLSAGTPPAVQHTDTGSFSFPILSLCQVATC